MSEFSTSKRRQELRLARRILFELPKNELFEVAGHPTVMYELRDYRQHPLGKEEGIKTARADIGFMFKAFETGQVRTGQPLPQLTSFPCHAPLCSLLVHRYWTLISQMEPFQGRRGVLSMGRRTLIAGTPINYVCFCAEPAAEGKKDIARGRSQDCHNPRVPRLDGDCGGELN
jgi:hypothetical protein